MQCSFSSCAWLFARGHQVPNFVKHYLRAGSHGSEGRQHYCGAPHCGLRNSMGLVYQQRPLSPRRLLEGSLVQRGSPLCILDIVSVLPAMPRRRWNENDASSFDYWTSIFCLHPRNRLSILRRFAVHCRHHQVNECWISAL